jgi:predicted O-methyltransferase YrrM
MNALDLLLTRYGVDPAAVAPIPLRISRHRELLALWRELGYRTLAEIGTEAGRYAEEICKANPEAHLTCVDPWLAYDRYADHVSQDRLDHFYEVAQHRLEKYNTTLIRETSLEAVHRFKSGHFDAVFIDGNHHFDFVVQDIIAWAPKVRRGGMVAGHDYKPEGSERTPIPFGVIEAVNAYTAAHKIKPFFITTRDRCPTWFWIKP